MRAVAVLLAVLVLAACGSDEHEDTAYAPSPSPAPTEAAESLPATPPACFCRIPSCSPSSIPDSAC